MAEVSFTGADAAQAAKIYIALEKEFPKASKAAIDAMVQEILEKYKEIAEFRKKAGLPPFDGEDSNSGAVASVLIGKKSFFGVNTTFQKTPEAKRRYRKKLYEKLKDFFPNAKNWAQVRFLTHAEVHALLRAKRYLHKRKSEMPKEVIMVVDKKTCRFCQNYLPHVMKLFGIKRMIIFCEGEVIIIPTTEKQKEKLK